MSLAPRLRVRQKDRLLKKLADSRHRFQTRMQQLLEKYNQPFEDDPLVRMSTLIYETPQGLRVWGGKLVKKRNPEDSQNLGPGSLGRQQVRKTLIALPQSEDFPVEVADRLNDSGQTTLESSEHETNSDSESSSADTSQEDEDALLCTWTPAVPGGSLENKLRRKYLIQGDILLLGEEHFKSLEERKVTSMALVPSLASPATPASGCCGSISAESPGDPGQLASSPIEWDPSHPCPANMTMVPKNEGPTLLGTGNNSCLPSMPYEDDDICNATISDLYAGMLHSMSQLLSWQPSRIISTKSYMCQTWNHRRRHMCKGNMQMNNTYCNKGRRSRKSPKGRSEPCLEPGKETGALINCKNLLHVQHRTCLKVQRTSLKGSKPQLSVVSPARKELQLTSQEFSSLENSLASLDLNTRNSFDQENRVKGLKWLLSPMKPVSKPRVLQDRAENQYGKIKVLFDKLHQECCQYLGKQPSLAGSAESWTLDVYRGGSGSPSGAQDVETPNISLPFSRGKSKRLREACENLDKRPTKAARWPPKDSPTQSPARWPPKSGPSSLPTKDSPTQSPARWPPKSGPSSLPTKDSPTQSPARWPPKSGPSSLPTKDSPTQSPARWPPKSGPSSLPTKDSPTQSPARWPPKSGPSSLPTKDSPTQSPGRSVWTLDLTSSGTAVSVPQMGPSGRGRSHYGGLKETFDKLHQQCCQTSPQQAKLPSQIRWSPGKASADVLDTGDCLGKLSVDSHFQKLSLSPKWHIKSPRDSTKHQAPGSTFIVCASTRDSQFSAKRRRLSYPQVSRDHDKCQEPSGEASTAWPWL